MNTSPHPTRNTSHRPHDTPPKHKLPLNPNSPIPTRSHPQQQPSHPQHQALQQPKRPHTAPSAQPPPIPSQPHPQAPQFQPPTQLQPPPLPPTTYTLSPGPTKPLPNPWQQLEEQALIQRELTAELLTAQGKNKGLVAENATLRERIAQFERPDQQAKASSSRLRQLESENHRLSGDLARVVRGKYDTDSSAFDSVLKEVAVLKKEQKKLTKHIEESVEKQESLQLVLQRLAENEVEDKAALDEIVQITEQYNEHLREKTREAEEALSTFQPDALQASLDKSTVLITDTRQQITEIGESCSSQNQSFASLRLTIEALQSDLQQRVDEMQEMNNEVSVLISANEGQTLEIESLRTALQQTTLARDEAQGELERLRMRATSLEDEHHFMKTEFTSKNTDLVESHASQLRELESEVNCYRSELNELRAEHAMMEAALRQRASEPSQETQTHETHKELSRLSKLAETHLQSVRDAERTNMILEEQLRHKDAELALLQKRVEGGFEKMDEGGSAEGKRKKRKDKRVSDSDSEDQGTSTGTESDSSSDEKQKKRKHRDRRDAKCKNCSRLTHELNEAKIETGGLQQKLDKVKNLIQIYRQEKRQMEEYIEKEKRTAKSMIADVTSLREVLDEKQALLSQLRDEITHLRNEATHTQQLHAQQLVQSQDLARIQIQLKEDEIRAKLDIQANMQKEIQRLQVKLERRKEELRGAQRAKKEADQTLEEQYTRLQMLDRNYVHTRHHHANYTSSAVSYLQSLESRISDMRSDVARTRVMQASCEDEVITPLRNALQTVRALMQETMRQFAEDAQLQEQEMSQLKVVVSALQHQPQVPQQQIIQHQQQLHQLQLQHQAEQDQLQQELEKQQTDNTEHQKIIQEQQEKISELKHEIRVLQLQMLEQQKGVDNKPPIHEQARMVSNEDVSQLYSNLEKTQELAEQLRIVSDESLYATEKLELLDAAQQHTIHELATQRAVFEEMRAANDAFIRNLEEQLWALAQATPRYLDNLDDEEKIKLREPDLAMHNFVEDMSKEPLTNDLDIEITDKDLRFGKLVDSSNAQPNLQTEVEANINDVKLGNSSPRISDEQAYAKDDTSTTESEAELTTEADNIGEMVEEVKEAVHAVAQGVAKPDSNSESDNEEAEVDGPIQQESVEEANAMESKSEGHETTATETINNKINTTITATTTNNNNAYSTTRSEQLSRKESVSKLDLSRVTSKDINSFISNINSSIEEEDETSDLDSASMGDKSEDEEVIEAEGESGANTARKSAVTGFNNFLSNFINDSDSEDEGEGTGFDSDDVP